MCRGWECDLTYKYNKAAPVVANASFLKADESCSTLHKVQISPLFPQLVS